MNEVKSDADCVHCIQCNVVLGKTMQRKKSILIVDDDPLLSKCIQGVLEAHGHEVACCPNGVVAMNLLREQPFDIILTDYHMPEMTGAQFTNIVRSRLSAPLIIGYSGYMMKTEFLQAGANVFLQKPFEFSELLSIIKQHPH